MKCWSCAGGIPDGSNFCGLCGAQQNPTERITHSGWLRALGAQDLRRDLPALPVLPDPPERTTEVNPALLDQPAPTPPALDTEPKPRPRFAALDAADQRARGATDAAVAEAARWDLVAENPSESVHYPPKAASDGEAESEAGAGADTPLGTEAAGHAFAAADANAQAAAALAGAPDAGAAARPLDHAEATAPAAPPAPSPPAVLPADATPAAQRRPPRAVTRRRLAVVLGLAATGAVGIASWILW